MSDLELRFKSKLEPILALPDPRPQISSYHDMPYAIFRYDPEEEFELRKQVSLLSTRLSQLGKRVTTISLAECLDDAMRQERTIEEWAAIEREMGTATTIETVHAVLDQSSPLPNLVMSRIPKDAEPRRDVVFIVRAGALFPVYRCHTILEQLHGRLLIPAVLFYPGTLDGVHGLMFMGVLDADPNYRPKIF